MIRELFITIYLTVFKLLFNLFKLLPLQHKVTFVVSFGDNSKYVYEEMRRQQTSFDIVFLCKGQSSQDLFQQYENIKLLSFESNNLLENIISIYHLATSQYIIVDNYYGFLSVTDFKENVECIQLWHAAGAIKKFGLEDQSNGSRSERAQNRFLKVYEKFDKVVVGSDAMAGIFMKAFNLPPENILRTGIPRTDFFFDSQQHQAIISKLESENKALKNKKTILYAPTYRDKELQQFKMELDLAKMQKELGEEYIVLLRLHPAIKKSEDYSKMFPGFVFDYSSSHYHINELLLVSDLLITDYSSIPYEYSLLNKPMIFFAYDLNEYMKDRGLWDDYDNMVPGPVVKDTDGIVRQIKSMNSSWNNEVKEFSMKWNKYIFGQSSRNLIQYLVLQEVPVEHEKRRAL
ncbi:CDP-glycerol glycerophosphotransferase family protein [Bacillus sp. FJAT-27251]|uniref:CDP-glycerol glycerophosphotransferase family protein n=1 Tax=Bacillus sp. FJAT-27251 TaxID=1684142 RepID=UPI0006A791BF|nr:CDP-glycerol glycerophosphotransferase family protein [Bacillus sp. FJAT-27251]